ncbi:hypothetical protein AB0N77_22150 [Streptomyces misionensis]|uniref:hypothetical protein n=1 Tax=Streptomyces misionensis TaxID=67331 RepID=UPI0034160878
MHLSFTALALYLSAYETGALVTPYEAQQVRAEAVQRWGFDQLRAEAFKAALFCSMVEPDAHADRFEWAEAAAAFVEEPYRAP